MSQLDVRAIQRPLRQRYAMEPKDASYVYRVRVEGDLDDPWHATAFSLAHGRASYRATINEKIGGSGEEPTPGDLLLAALATCQAMTVKNVAASLGVTLLALAVDVSGDVDHRGVLAMPGARAGLQSVRCRVSLRAAPGTDAASLSRLKVAAEQCCAATDTIRNPTPLALEFEID